MDQSDSKSGEIPDEAEHVYSPGKIEDLSNITDEKPVLERQGHLSDQEISNCEKENHSNYHISASDCSGVDTTKSPIEHQMCQKEVSTDGGTSVVTSCSNDNASSTLQNSFSTDIFDFALSSKSTHSILPISSLNKSSVAVQITQKALQKIRDGDDNKSDISMFSHSKEKNYEEASISSYMAGRFDLNEVFLGNEVECGVTAVSIPVPMVAKSEFYVGLRITPLKYEGELGWKGSAATSAFKRIRNKNPKVLTGFDLNVAAVSEDDFTPTTMPFHSKRLKGMDIDLNALGENDDFSLSRSSKVNFDLNDDPLSHGEQDFSRMWGFNLGPEPKFPYTPEKLPFNSYPYYNMYPSGVVPCITNPNILPPPHFIYAERESGVPKTRQLISPARDFLTEGQFGDFQQGSMAATPMKRKEPDGGWDTYQFGYRQVPNEYRMY